MTRKVTHEIVDAFLKGKSKKIKSTRTDGKGLYLHGHKIAWVCDEPNPKTGLMDIAFSMCGWGSVTTRERLNGLLDALGYPQVGISQRKGEQWLVYKADKVQEIDAHGTFMLSDINEWVAAHNAAKG